MKLQFSELINSVKEDGYILNQSDHFTEIAYGLSDSAVQEIKAIRNDPDFDNSILDMNLGWDCKIIQIKNMKNSYQFVHSISQRFTVSNRSLYSTDKERLPYCQTGVGIFPDEKEDKKLVVHDSRPSIPYKNFNIRFTGFNKSVCRFVWNLYGLTQWLINDLLREADDPTVDFDMTAFKMDDYQRMAGCRTKREVIEKFYPGSRLFKKINVLPLKYGLLFAEAQAVVQPDQVSYLTDIVSQHAHSLTKELQFCYADTVAGFLRQIYCLAHPEFRKSAQRNQIIRDCFEMEIRAGEPVSLKRSYRAIETKHDEIAFLQDIQRIETIQIPETPLKYLEMPDNYTLLNTRESLYYEGKYQKNCVASYAGSINSGNCIIYHGEVLGESLTIEVYYDQHLNSFGVRQCYQSCNRDCSDLVETQVLNDLKEATKPALERYNKTHSKESTVIMESEIEDLLLDY